MNYRLALALSCMSCAGGAVDAPPTPPEPPRPLVIATSARLDPLLTPTIAEATSNDLLPNIVLPMFAYTFRPLSAGVTPAGLQFGPMLAQDWAWSDQGEALAVRLRPDVVWSDGHPVTADDVLFTWELTFSPAVNSPRARARDLLPVRAEQSPTNPFALGDDVIVFRFAGPGPTQARQMHASAGPTPRHALADAPPEAIRQHSLATRPLASGAYQLAAPATPEGLTLEANPRAPAWVSPAIPRVEVRVIPDESTRLALFAQGQIDVLAGVTVSDASAMLPQRPDARIADRGWRTLDIITFNPKHPLLATPEGRRAFGALIDLDALAAALLVDARGTPHGARAQGIISPELLSTAGLPPPAARDLPGALAALAALGWVDHNGDGTLDRDGTPLSLRLMYRHEARFRVEMAGALQSQLAAAGVTLRLEAGTKEVIDERIRSGDWDLNLYGAVTGLAIDPSGFLEGPYNQGKIPLEALAALRDQALREPDPATAQPIWAELQRQYMDALPVMPLWWRGELVLVSGAVTDATIDWVSSLHDLHTWRMAP